MRWISIAPLFLFVACSATAGSTASRTSVARSPDGVEPAGGSESPDTVSPEGPAQQDEGPSAVATPEKSTAETPTEERLLACPTGMVMVEGQYCTEVEQDCLQSWYDESNKKTVCEVFDTKTRCVGDRLKKRFCIDRYSWPNRQGERPEVMNRFNEAQVKCAAIGKRLCTESEWTLACEGPKMKPFPYGYVRDTRKCNGDQPWDSPNMEKVRLRDAEELARLWKGVRSGSQPQCISDYGVADMPGNNDEVVASETVDNGWRGKYDSVHTGGPWYKGVRNQCRPKIYTHDEGFYYYFLGFRCCAEPDGQQTDPRTVKQRAADWKFERVERIAGFTREEVRAALALKAKQGDCGCAEKEGSRAKRRCNTICGTLLGPDAVDATRPAADGLPPFGAKKRATPEQLKRALDAGQPTTP